MFASSLGQFWWAWDDLTHCPYSYMSISTPRHKFLKNIQVVTLPSTNVGIGRRTNASWRVSKSPQRSKKAYMPVTLFCVVLNWDNCIKYTICHMEFEISIHNFFVANLHPLAIFVAKITLICTCLIDSALFRD
jgi:hypothetical protein